MTKRVTEADVAAIEAEEGMVEKGQKDMEAYNFQPYYHFRSGVPGVKLTMRDSRGYKFEEILDLPSFMSFVTQGYEALHASLNEAVLIRHMEMNGVKGRVNLLNNLAMLNTVRSALMSEIFKGE